MWLRPQGYAEIVSPDDDTANLDRLQKVRIRRGSNEFDSCTCAHCGSVFHVGAKQKPEDIGGMCPQCWKPICPRCLDKGCTPLEKRLEQQERRVQALRSYGVL